MIYRQAKVTDSQQMADLIYRVALLFKAIDFTDIGWQFSCEFNTVENIEARFEQSNYVSHVCEVDNQLVGLISIADNQVITQLFVDEDFREKGVASRLWQESLNAIGEQLNLSQFRVKSSSFAIKFYEKLGFEIAGERQCSNGIWYIPMVMRDN